MARPRPCRERGAGSRLGGGQGAGRHAVLDGGVHVEAGGEGAAEEAGERVAGRRGVHGRHGVRGEVAGALLRDRQGAARAEGDDRVAHAALQEPGRRPLRRLQVRDLHAGQHGGLALVRGHDVEVRPHVVRQFLGGRGVQDHGQPGRRALPCRVAGDLRADLELEQEDADPVADALDALRDHRLVEGGVGERRDDDVVLARGVHPDVGDAGAALDRADLGERDAVRLQAGQHDVAERVLAHAGGHPGRRARVGRGHGLVGALAAEHEGEVVAEHGLTAPRQPPAERRDVRGDAPDDENTGGFHGGSSRFGDG